MLKAYRPPKGRKRLQLGATIPRDLIDRLAAQSVREQRTRSQIVEEAIRHYLAEVERKAA